MTKKSKNIVLFGLQPWDTKLGSNAKSMALELAKQHFVLYVNRPLDRFSQFRRRNNAIVQKRLDVISNKQPALEQVEPNLWVFTPPIVVESIQKIPFYKVFQFFNKRNNQRLANAIKKVLVELDIEDFILLNDSSMFLGYYLKELLQPNQYIYYIRDNLISQPYFKGYGPKTEASLIAKADQVVCNSAYLVQYAEQFRNKAFDIGQGCDLAVFNPGLKTNLVDYRSPNTAVVGYVGTLTTQRLDLEMLEDLAQLRPDWNFVFVGPEDDEFANSILHQFEHVYFLGFQPLEKLAGYIDLFDVCINPQLLNEMCIGNYPRKVDEYLAMGKPVVATNTLTMQDFEPHVLLANGVDQYIQKIEQACCESGDEKAQLRIDFAKSHSWEATINKLWASLEQPYNHLK